MSTNQGPRGRLPRSVYIKRRLWVLAGLIAVIAIIVLLIWRPGSSSGAEKPKQNAAQSETSTPAPTTSAAEKEASDEPVACTKDNVEVVAKTDKTTYASGELPKLSLTITNTGDAACTIDAGTSQQVFTITSGDDTYWTSTDCQVEPTNAETTIKPGKSLTSEPAIEWDRTRSNPDTCDSDEREPVPADGASYHLTTSIAGIESKDTAQFALY
ncbi:hypothetical protein [Paramicrobacterium agarici]|uniref:DUF4232 domain-containing protein n=1 Tax=Paramicrobacterium agarici TaxID=630514 RepID=A0A2A9DV66_9MICO|nr:hypothetical protein [Microbacterium agarici]PFG30493.1 hypothetical protein ATJ78_1425 [Microbacterium agarici]TQO23505.1 hypothetical protein FB385_2359 [Microbacterium agarici]